MFEIYVITCHPTNKQYVGQTKNGVDIRWRHHTPSPGYRGIEEDDPQFSVADALLKYGKSQFSIEHIASALNRCYALEVESILIRQNRTYFPFGYNRKLGTLPTEWLRLMRSPK